MLLKLAIREILNNRRFSLFFVLNLALGLSGFIVLDAFKGSLEQELNAGSKNILTADLTVSVGNRYLTDAEKKQAENLVPPKHSTATSISSFSMAAYGGKSKLVYLVGISENYPLYGTLELNKLGEVVSDTPKPLGNKPTAWIFPELALQLSLSIGDSIKLGDKDFEITDIIEKDTTATASAFSLAPKVYIHQKYYQDTNLLRAGSRFTHTQFYKSAEFKNLESTIEAMKLKLDSKDLKIKSHKNASEDLARSLTYLSDYLGLIALIALFLSAVGSAYLFRSFVMQRLKDIAILMSLGAPPSSARAIYFLQIFLLGIISALIAIVISRLAFPIVPFLAGNLLPVQVYPEVSLQVALVALLMGSLGSTLICLPLLAQVGKIKPIILFQESVVSQPFQASSILLLLPTIFVYWLLAVVESKSLVNGSIFLAAFITSSLFLSALSLLIFKGFAKIKSKSFVNFNIALRYLSRNTITTGTCFLTISLGTLLISLIPQLHTIVIEEVSNPKGFELPSLFLVDIQDDQIEPLKKLAEDNQLSLDYLSPVIRARLTKINGEDLRKYKSDGRGKGTREEESRKWVRTRGQNLTYRQELISSEKLIEGRGFNGKYDRESDKPAEITLEMRFARRLGVEVGDTLDFDIQGVAIKALIVGIRSIKWTSFHPNFFVVFQPGVIDDAPKMFLASMPNMEKNKRLDIQNKVVDKFSNISIIDVENTVSRIMGILEKMGWIINAMAIFALVAGLVVLFSIAHHMAQARKWDINMYKILGATFQDVRKIIFIEFGLLGLLASSSGAFISFIISFLFSHFVFDSPWIFNPVAPGLAIIIITFLGTAVSYSATSQVLKESPAQFLG